MAGNSREQERLGKMEKEKNKQMRWQEILQNRNVWARWKGDALKVKPLGILTVAKQTNKQKQIKTHIGNNSTEQRKV